MARQFALLVPESSYGVPMTSPVIGTDAFYIPITQSNGVTIRETPTIGKLMHGGGVNSQSCAYSSQSQISGQIQTPLWDGPLTGLLLDLALTPVNVSRTLPFPTTDPNYVMKVGDLASFTIYFAHEQADGTFLRKGYHGLKVLGGNVSVSAQSQAGAISLTIGGGTSVSTPNSTLFPEPSPEDFPCGVFTFTDTEGGFKAGSVRTLYGGLEVAWTNAITPKFHESKYVRTARFTGRQSTVNVSELLLRPSPDDDGSYQSLTAFETEVKLSNGNSVLTIGLPISRWATLTPDFSLESEYVWNGSIESFFDASIGADVTVSYEPVGGGD